jgi:SAM-dependent methyltransferase
MNQLLSRLRSQPLAAALWRQAGKVAGPRFHCYRRHRADFVGKIGLELGGPSNVFSAAGRFPLYPIAARVDHCNFRHETLWERDLSRQEKLLKREAPVLGERIIAEAVHLPMIASETYDFVLSSHMLEHSANPLQALAEWQRVTKPGGALLLILPHKDGTFDHRRPVTTLHHLVEDFEHRVGEDDLTHLAEILRLHDIALDPGAGSRQQFEERCGRNFENRGMHQHVFDMRLGIEVVDAAGYQIRTVEAVRPHHIAILATKPAGAPAENRRFLDGDSQHFGSSPFPSDRSRAPQPQSQAP